MNASPQLHLVECPRDAIQGWPHPVSTEDKLAYFRSLLRVGFDTLDMGSFVSPKAIPAMADTAQVLRQLEEEGIWDQTHTKGLVIVANERGVREAVEYDSVSAVGFPLSISPTFQERNTRASLDEAWRRLDVIAGHCARANKDLVVYLSMGFGNPYGDEWSEEMPTAWARQLLDRLSPSVISLADTVGAATPDLVERVFRSAVARSEAKCLGPTFTFIRWKEWKKSKQRTEVAAFEWTAPCEEWVDAPSHKTTWWEMHPQSGWLIGRKRNTSGRCPMPRRWTNR